MVIFEPTALMRPEEFGKLLGKLFLKLATFMEYVEKIVHVLTILAMVGNAPAYPITG